AVFDPGTAEIAAADEGDPVTGFAGVEDVGLRVEAGRGVREDPDLKGAGRIGVIGPVEEEAESGAVGDLQIVGGEDADAGASGEGVVDSAGDDLDAGAHEEAHHQVDPIEIVTNE